MKKKLSKILNIVVTVLIVCVLLISALILAVSFTSNDENSGVPNIFGKAPVSVLTDSMAGEDELCFNAGDLIICDVVSDKETATYNVGDVVTFQQDIDYDGVVDLVTHRIYKVNKDGSYLTKGDNNETYDQDPNATAQFTNITKYDVVAAYHGMKIPVIGNFFAYIRTPMGFFLCVLLPMILFFIYEAVRVVINVIAYNREKAIENAQAIVNSSVLTEEQKKRAIEEYLAAQGGNIPIDTTEDTPTDDVPTEDNSVAE